MVREAVVVGLVAIVASCVSGACPAVEAAVTGPMLGAVDEHSARVWLRPGGEAEVTLTIRDPDGLPVFEETKKAAAAHDFCLHWQAGDLKPATGYAYSFTWHSGGGEAAPVGPWPLQTAPPADLPGRACLAFGSCASEKFPAIWERRALKRCCSVATRPTSTPRIWRSIGGGTGSFSPSRALPS